MKNALMSKTSSASGQFPRIPRAAAELVLAMVVSQLLDYSWWPSATRNRGKTTRGLPYMNVGQKHSSFNRPFF
jgi:hypothetical protein